MRCLNPSEIMKKQKVRRVTRVIGRSEQARLNGQRKQIAGELVELTAGDQMRKEAREERTLSGELRRAIHASPRSLSDIAGEAGIAALTLDEFLTGARTLRSDVLDRLSACVGFVVARQA